MPKTLVYKNKTHNLYSLVINPPACGENSLQTLQTLQRLVENLWLVESALLLLA